MTNILIMLALLTVPYLLLRLSAAAGFGPFDSRAAAAWGAGILFVFTGTGHFIQTEQFTWMLPAWVPQRTLLIYATGVLEFAIAAGFFFARTRRLAAFAAITVLIAFFPANIYAAMMRIPMSGNAWGPIYLLVRAPLQVFIVVWIYRLIVKGRETSL